VDSELSVHSRIQRAMDGLDQAALLDVSVEAVQEACDSAEGEVMAVGFGIPCLMDQRTGVARVAINLPLAEIRFADVMAERLGLPVFVDNDANVAALAEHRVGAAAGCTEAVLLTIGTGIGGGLILRGELYRGCVEALASGTALAREARRAAAEQPDSALARAQTDGYELTGPLVTELAHDGDAAARSVLELIGTRLGVAVANYVNIFNPQVVVIGGGVMAAGDLVLEPARAEVAARALGPSRDEVRIVPAALGVEAGMIGAAALAYGALGEPAGGSPT
jgi:glucokinase